MKFKAEGRFVIEHWRKNRLIDKFAFKNGITTPGFNKILDIMFRNQTQIASWYIGLIDNASYVALAAADTMASHAGWIENNDYSQVTRPAWLPTAAAAQAITGPQAVFTMTGTKHLKGAFITSSNVKTGAVGTLWSTGLFDSVKDVVNLDTFKVIYTLSAA